MGKRKRDKYNPTNLNRQKALTIVSAFCGYCKRVNDQSNTTMPSLKQDYSCLWDTLHVLRWKMKQGIFAGLTKKHPSGTQLQISNSEGWYQNVQFCGRVLVRG